ncbi:saccharopine dehydrogenase [Wenxinia saemankumensis]|uniref:Saccharopine dehydrogenase [NAD(+), L-lysine-forming] n=1 Tax=Wenxinia saemankumensis TaxID=1447782 RepID=A0A1M6E5Q6_9RHOB|nr:saccharopine dehydrogenase [Wenxinia saemankumensis]SHI80745.1 saccharopine dehydrogenase (NAD+, L-lysine-forming) [Wenxinia saemankumensis]
MSRFHLRVETRPNERRAALTPEGTARLIAAGHAVIVEESAQRVFPLADYVAAGAGTAPAGAWRDAPDEAIILGLKELPEETTPLRHRHVMFGHAYKGQLSGRALLGRFRAGGGTLLDMEYLVDPAGRRVAAFGYWAGFAGAGVTLLALAAQRRGGTLGPVEGWRDADALAAESRAGLEGPAPTALIVGAAGRVGAGVADLLGRCGIAPTLWDKDETAEGGPFPQIAAHELFFNCILARPGTPVFVDRAMAEGPRALRAIGDIACDPDSDYNPVPLYDAATGWEAPVLRVAADPPLDLMAIDNLPSLLPRESSADFAGQLLPHLMALDEDPGGVWTRAAAEFARHAARDGTPAT